jgi:uncharacterized phage infection (PIP) family protein YhgE
MTLYETPITAAFELQRTALQSGKKAAETGVELQEGIHQSMVSGVESQQRIQRRILSMQQVTCHRVARRIEERSPGPPDVTAELLDVVDEQFDQLYESHADLFEGVTDELENGTDAFEEFADDSLDAIDEQLELILETSEQIESQSVEATEQLDEQLALLETQLDELQKQFDRAQAAVASEMA